MTAGPSALSLQVAHMTLGEALLGAPADRVLKRALRRHPDLTNTERAHVADIVMGVCCLLGRLRFQLEQAELPRETSHLIALYLLDERESQGVLELDVSRAALHRTRFPDEPVARLAAFRSLPPWLARRLVDERGAEAADALAATLNRPGPVTLRTNALKATREELRSALAAEGISSSPAGLSPWALHVQARANLRGSSCWQRGLFEVQDEGSQLIALATRARPGDVVIDYCAGRGGKTLALAALLKDEGRVFAYDVDARRLQDLLPRRDRAGARCIEVALDVGALPHDADVVLVDAPCSETGVLRRGPHNRWLLDEEEAERLPAQQLAILKAAAERVKTNGTLVYATCSLLQSENEAVVDGFLGAHPRFAKVGEQTLLPHVEGTDGFFIATLVADG